MLNGLWTVEFSSALNIVGKGVLVLSDGRLFGGDSGYYYSGNFKVDGNTVSGTIEATRFDINSVSVFGDIGDFSLSFDGTVSGATIDGLAKLKDIPSIEMKFVCNKKEEF